MLVTLWELPTFTTVTEAVVVMKQLARQGIHVQHVSAKNMSTKRADRNSINEMMDEFISVCNSNAQDCKTEADAFTLAGQTGKATVAQSYSDSWFGIRQAMMTKRDSLIKSKEKIMEQPKLW